MSAPKSRADDIRSRGGFALLAGTVLLAGTGPLAGTPDAGNGGVPSSQSASAGRPGGLLTTPFPSGAV